MPRPRKYKWDNYPGELLRYGKPCRARKHQDSTGQSLRTKDGKCLACEYHLPDGLFTHNCQNVAPITLPNKKYATPEEARKAHVARQILWNKNNPEKYKAAQKRYTSKKEVKEHRVNKYAQMTEEQREAYRARQREQYHSMSPEEKRALLDASKERYRLKKLKDQDEHSGS